MKKISLDINCDLGEGLENDALLMPLIQSCNIACGGHAGDEQSMKNTINLAKKFNVKAGAHPSYPDRENFGRKVMEISMPSLKRSLKQQIFSFFQISKAEDYPMHHIKPHGALYNELAKNPKLAEMLVDLILSDFPNTILYCPPQSVIEKIAKQYGISVMLEVFADRNYHADYSLVQRNHPQAVITDPAFVLAHVENMLINKKIKTLEGIQISIKADTFCVHGDNPNALEILNNLRKNIKFKNGYPIF
jgi:UPF0271 protein